MKKFLLIIFLFFCCINVNAQERRFAGSEYLTGISYMKYDGNTHYYRNAQVIRDVDTGDLAYCVEPFTLLVNNTSYSVSDYRRYGISDEKWDKIKLISFYGYGYGGHTNKRWISITQMLIWRTMYPNYLFEWIDNVDDKIIISPYNKDIKEVMDMVNSHYTLPKLNNNYSIDVNGVLTLTDSNSVLKYYNIISSDFKVDKSNDTLVISAGDIVKEGTIRLQRAGNNYDHGVSFFYSSSSQNVISRGDVKPIDFEIKVNVTTGKIIVNKTEKNDLDLGSKEAKLDGSVFELYDSDMNLISESTVIDNVAVFDNLSFGKYYVKEKKPGKGYYLNNNVYEILIDENNIEQELIIENELIKSKVVITKYYGTKKEYDNNQMKREKNINFLIFDSSNNLVYSGITNKNGILEVVLPYGNYVLKQINSTNGYKVADDYLFSIDEKSSYSIDIVLYDFKIDVPNAGINLIEYLNYFFEKLFS